MNRIALCGIRRSSTKESHSSRPRCLIDFAEEGRVLFDGRDAGTLPIEERQVGIVFQHYALFGHMSVSDNVAFGSALITAIAARHRGFRRAPASAGAARRLWLAFPGQLSGDERAQNAVGVIVRNTKFGC
jgi:ABC-type Fe3+/spermidine/putrescine transport system ATPase subunit